MCPADTTLDLGECNLGSIDEVQYSSLMSPSFATAPPASGAPISSDAASVYPPSFAEVRAFPMSLRAPGRRLIEQFYPQSRNSQR